MEYALKRAGVRKGDPDSKVPRKAEAAWKKFGVALEEPFRVARTRNASLEAAVRYLIDHPPKIQEVVDGRLTFSANAEDSDTASSILARVCMVRNNAFHGGKFPTEPHLDPLRDRALVDAAITVLLATLEIASVDETLGAVTRHFREDA